MFLFELKNEAAVRQGSFSAEPVELETHSQWFNRKVADEDCVILIAEDNGRRIGEIRFDVDRKTGVAEVDIAVVPKCRAKGYGVRTMQMGCNYAFEKLHIKAENEISIKMCTRAGFSSCGYIDYRAQKAVQMVLKRGDYSDGKDKDSGRFRYS